MPKISALTPASTLGGTEVFPVVQSGETRKASVTNLGTFIFTGYGVNTFPARASTGALEPKPITDYGLSLVNVASANAALAAIGAQASDPTLSALAVYNANGLITQTAADTFVGRTITGTSNRVTVTDGNGVSGNPTVDIAATYVGQTSITTLGTIATGTWNATTIAANRGGTGISSYTTGNYINAASSSTLQQRTPAQVRTDLGVTTCSDGTYTPTVSATVNIDSTTPHVSQWLRVGNTVTVSGYIDIDTTAAASTLTQLQLSLPVASDFNALEQCGGTTAGNTVNEAGIVLANVANNTAAINFLSLSTGVRAVAYQFTYLVR